MTYTTIGTNNYQFILNLNLTNYSGGGKYLNSLAFEVGSSVTSFSILSTPDGVSNWNYVQGGLNANGCNGNGAGFACMYDTTVHGAAQGFQFNPQTYQFKFDMGGSPLTPSGGVEIKAMYEDLSGKKVGSLVSAPVTPTAVAAIPEPETYAMMLTGLGVLGEIARRRKQKRAS
ncbi:MAG: PEP-CTERM sorting domain-containing protein [Proteobacteria bacterium]|nr:PEP-CTERM sorting domain-containing protein [Pseudomonadota bacterium]